MHHPASRVRGDTVLVRGTVVLERDFGYGYRSDRIIEEATVAIE